MSSLDLDDLVEIPVLAPTPDELLRAAVETMLDGFAIFSAVRDDQGMAIQLGWIPPSLGFLFRCHQATKRARAAARVAV